MSFSLKKFIHPIFLLICIGQTSAGNIAKLTLYNNAFTYSSAYTDPESHLQYLQARYYDALIIHFISRDSYDLTNRYGYVDGNPIMYQDPSGHMRIGANVCMGVDILEEPGFFGFKTFETAVLAEEGSEVTLPASKKAKTAASYIEESIDDYVERALNDPEAWKKLNNYLNSSKAEVSSVRAYEEALYRHQYYLDLPQAAASSSSSSSSSNSIIPQVPIVANPISDEEESGESEASGAEDELSVDKFLRKMQEYYQPEALDNNLETIILSARAESGLDEDFNEPVAVSRTVSRFDQGEERKVTLQGYRMNHKVRGYIFIWLDDEEIAMDINEFDNK